MLPRLRFRAASVARGCLLLVWFAFDCSDGQCPSGTIQEGEVCRSLSAQSAMDNAAAHGSLPGLEPVSGIGSLAMSPAAGGLGSGTAGNNATLGNTPATDAAGNASSVRSVNATAGAPGGSNAGNGSAMTVPVCTEPGAMRCVPDGKGQREQCSGGTWIAAASCSQGETCAGAETGKPGSCLALAEICQGKQGTRVCDGSGVLYECDRDGVIAHPPEHCASVELCNAGLPNGKCASCVPGEHECSGTVLNVCSPAGDGVTAQETCVSSDLCDGEHGRCLSPVCSQNQYVCMGDDLYQCNPSQSDFQRIQSCGAGLCNATTHACNACKPGSPSRCEGQVAVSCSSTGEFVRTTCPKACNSGVCADCNDDDMMPCGMNEGQCRAGFQACIGGRFSGLCLGEVGPTPEVCDGIDNDCDGQRDECEYSWLTCTTSGSPRKCLPSGSYLSSCDINSCYVSNGGKTLNCMCFNGGSTATCPSSIALPCSQDISQYHGALVCGQPTGNGCGAPE